MSKNIFLVATLAMCILPELHTQEIDLKLRTLENFHSYELSKKGTAVDTLASYGVLIDPDNDSMSWDTRAYIYRRTDDTFLPQLHVWYNFEKYDNRIASIRYNWGLHNPSFKPKDNQELLSKLIKREKEFSTKFKSLEKELKKKLGEPSTKKMIADNSSKYARSIYWDNGNEIVILSIDFSRQLMTLPQVGATGDYEVSVVINNKRLNN